VVTNAIDAVLDHVAVAVPEDGAAEGRWRDRLGGEPLFGADHRGFRFFQYRYANGAKLELLRPSAHDPSPGNFVRRFLSRYGAGVHHVTLKVPDLPQALVVLARAGLDVVDVALDGNDWREGFLRPTQVGGLVVQVAWQRGGDEEWARRHGYEVQPPGTGSAELLGPRLRHPDLAAAGRLWAVLGATVDQRDGALCCRWPASPLEVLIERGEPAGALALRMRGTPSLPADDTGPAVEAVR
jgi:Glyoxalase/Bleomycin resistance protein/Dioxygenase superfamily